jgi:hypothetical protein
VVLATAVGCTALKLAGGKPLAIFTAGAGVVVSVVLGGTVSGALAVFVVSVVLGGMVGGALAVVVVGAKGSESMASEPMVGRLLAMAVVDVAGAMDIVLALVVGRTSAIAIVRDERAGNRLLIESTTDLTAAVTAVLNDSGALVEICASLELPATPISTSGAVGLAVACISSNGI